MVPVIASSGASFRGSFHYYCHDKRGRTTERVAWTHTVNMLTDCVAKAWKVMAYTAKHQDRLKQTSGQKATGAKLKKPVFAFSLSWAPDQRPDKDTMIAAALRALDALGLAEHQAYIVAHSDRAHPHVHIVANTVHPQTGLAAKLTYSKRRLSDFALGYERDGGKIYCSRRAENRQKRDRGEPTRYCDPVIAGAWTAATDAADFAARLEARGYQLAAGRKMIVIVDPYGKTINPVRHLNGVRAPAFTARMAFIGRTLPSPEQVLARRRAAEDARAAETAQRESAAKAALERLAARHAEERDELHRQFAREVAAKRDELALFYHLAEKRAALSRLVTEQKRGGFWRRLTRRMFGQDKRLQDDIERLEFSLNQARWRMGEALDGLKNRHALAAADLARRQRQERDNPAAAPTPDRQASLASAWPTRAPAVPA